MRISYEQAVCLSPFNPQLLWIMVFVYGLSLELWRHPLVAADVANLDMSCFPFMPAHQDHAGAHQDQGQALRLHEPCERLRAREPIAPRNVNAGRLPLVPATQPTAAPFQPLAPNAGQHGQAAHVAHERQANELLRSRVGPEPLYVHQTRGNFRGPSSTHQLQVDGCFAVVPVVSFHRIFNH